MLDFGTVQTKGSNLTLTNNFILANTINLGGVTGGFLDANGATLRISGNISGPGGLEIVPSSLRLQLGDPARHRQVHLRHNVTVSRQLIGSAVDDGKHYRPDR